MIELSYRVDKVWFRDFGAMVAEMLEKLPADRVPLRLVFFGNPDNNGQYLEHRAEILRQVSGRYGGIQMPLVSYVAQPPLDCGLALESHWAQVRNDRDKKERVVWTRKVYKQTNYIRLDTRLGRWLFTEGILPGSLEAPIGQQAAEVLGVLGEILAKEGLPVDAIVRQWNYIEGITRGADSGDGDGTEDQHYQAFNNARSEFYGRVKWPRGYPAATGIGTRWGGIMVEVDALAANKSKRIVALDNALQVAAHDYSQRVLVGRESGDGSGLTTPKFERAKAVVFKREREIQVYISGTAAIRGERSSAATGVDQQTEITLENIRYLVSELNLGKHGIKTKGAKAKIKNFRVYLKAESALEPVRQIILEQYGAEMPALYVQTDVCRDELLVEIEGVAQTW